MRSVARANACVATLPPRTIVAEMKSTQALQNLVRVIGCANGNAGRKLGCEEAARVMRQSPFLANSTVPFQWEEPIEETVSGQGLAAIPGVVKTAQKLAAATSRAVASGERVMVVGGDHSCAIGTWSGVASALRRDGDLGLIWVDAHLDAHTPVSSETGNIHGMPVAHLLGIGDPALATIGDGKPKIFPHNLCFVGIRSFESPEQDLLEGLGVRIFYMDEVRRRGICDVMQEAHHIVTRNTVGFGLSIDIDGFRVADAPAVGTPEASGIVAREFLHSLLKLDLRRLVAAEIVEFLPRLDDENKTSERLVANLLQTISELKLFQEAATRDIERRLAAGATG